jgi:hypothetical protein
MVVIDWLAPASSEEVAPVVYYNWTGTYMQVLVATSTDAGKTWTQTPVAPASDTHDQFFPWINVSSAGVIGVSWLDRRNDPNNVNYEAFAAFSTDWGKSFGKNFDLSGKPSNPFNGYLGYFIGDYTGNRRPLVTTPWNTTLMPWRQAGNSLLCIVPSATARWRRVAGRRRVCSPSKLTCTEPTSAQSSEAE